MTTRPLSALLGILVGISALAPTAPVLPPAPYASLIRGVTVVPMDGSGPLVDHDVAVVDGRIDVLAPGGHLEAPAGAMVVDADGAFLLPGLVDMHVHVTEADLGLLLAHGVTTAREMNGSERHLEWREEIDGGRRPGPRLLVASPVLAGEPVPWRHELVESPEQARRLVAAHAEAGYDLVKVYDGLDRVTWDALVQEARARGLPVAGHIPREVGLGAALHARQGLEHAEKIVRAARGPLDAETLPFLATHLRDAGVWVTPMLASQRALATAGSKEYRAALEARSTRWVSDEILGWWRSLADGSQGGPGAADGSYRTQQQLTVAMLRAGVPMLAGSDTPNPLMVPGAALLDEIEALVEAGLDRRDALALATASAGRYLREVLGRDEDIGVVRAGAVADLMLVDGDPLQDLEALRRPRAVVAGGRWLDRERLDEILEQVERRRRGAGADGDGRASGGGR